MDLTTYQYPFLSTDPIPPPRCDIIDKDYYAILTISETCVALLVYTLILGRVIY
jgi:hypothetical protein